MGQDHGDTTVHAFPTRSAAAAAAFALSLAAPALAPQSAAADRPSASVLHSAALRAAVASAQDVAPAGAVGVNAGYGYAMLDHAEHVNTKPLYLLEARAAGALTSPVLLSGSLIALLDAQTSNRDSKFGYLMRNPTSANQIGDTVSEAVVHNAQLAVTAQVGDALTAYAELLYEPQQSFGTGTITGLERNQIQARRAFLVWGDRTRSPVYAAIGKMDTPFGLNDTVSPFTNSSVWHAFAGLAYGAQVGYADKGLHLRAMAIQGGAQFRGHNAPVEGTNVPSQLNNFAIDANYTLADWPRDARYTFGASYQHASAYCQSYPVVHFNPCEEANPAVAVYGSAQLGDLELLGELTQTLDPWPGSAVPDPTNPLSVFEPVETSAFNLGGRYGFGRRLDTGTRARAVSLEFSNFRAGAEGAPWERQNQLTAGVSQWLTPSVNVFGEYVRVEGFAPLNFVSGGNFPDGSTWSDRDARTDVLLLGAQVAF